MKFCTGMSTKALVVVAQLALSAIIESCSSSDGGSGAAEPTPTASPTVEPTVYVGGQFTSIGGVAANGFAKLSASKWSSVGEFQSADATTRVYTFSKDQNNKLIVGGVINTSSGLSSKVIGRWDNSWSSVGNLTSQIIAATAVDSKGVIYAGGVDSTSGANSLHKFNGTTWSDLGVCPNYIYAIVIDAKDVPYVGCGPSTVKSGTGYVKKWDGSSWSDVGSGMTGGAVTSLAFDSTGVLYAGGAFTSANGVSANGIAKWNGSNWEAIGDGQTGIVYSIAFDSKGTLYAAGDSLQNGNIVYWTGTKWTGLSATPNKGVFKIMFDSSNRLYAGGFFTTAGSVVANGFARWDGTSWSALGNDSSANSIVRAIFIE